MSSSQTIRTLAVRDVPLHPHTKLDFVLPPDIVLDTKGVKSFEIRVIGTNELLGTIPSSSDLGNVRLQDVDCCAIRPKKKQRREEREDEQSLRLIGGLPASMMTKPEYTKNPFPHGTDSIEEITLIGADRFQTVMNCYMHWFGDVPVHCRIQREFRALDMGSIPLETLKTLEEETQAFWKQLHGVLMNRLR